MKNLDCMIVGASLSALLSCNAPDKRVKTTCEKVHDTVQALYWGLPVNGLMESEAQKSHCETLQPQEQELLLGEQMKLLQVSGFRPLPPFGW